MRWVNAGLLPGTLVVVALLTLTGCQAIGDTTAVESSSGSATAVPSQDEVNAQIIGCMGPTGWAYELDGDGAPVFSYPDAQKEEFEKALQQCVDDLPVPEFTEDQWHNLLALRKESAECLEALDFDVSAPPSYEVFVESDGAWNPFAEALDRASERFTEFQEKCPDAATF